MEAGRIAAALSCSPSHINRTINRFVSDGLCGLIDRREYNGTLKADERYVVTVRRMLRKRPRDFGHRRTTWSKRLLIATAKKQTGRLTWAKSKRKNSLLFIELLRKLRSCTRTRRRST